MYYYAAGTRGAGVPILLLHGFLSSSHLWSRVVPLLPTGRRVIVADLVGHGRSDRANNRDELVLERQAERVGALLNILGIREVAVAGHDVGGQIALVLANREPHRVSSVCLVNCSTNNLSQGLPLVLRRPWTGLVPLPVLLSRLHRLIVRGFSSQELGRHSADQYLRPFAGPGGRAQLLAHLDVAASMAGTMPAVGCPVALLGGTDDPYLGDVPGRPSMCGAAMFAERVEGGKHYLPEEAPERVAAALGRAFMKR